MCCVVVYNNEYRCRCVTFDVVSHITSSSPCSLLTTTQLSLSLTSHVILPSPAAPVLQGWPIQMQYFPGGPDYCHGIKGSARGGERQP